MLKAADALHEAGYRVRVVSTRATPWATVTDAELVRSRGWTWSAVDFDRSTAPGRRAASGLRFRAAVAAARAIGPDRVPIGLAIRAYSRVHDELAAAIVKEPCDLVYGGTTGALAAVAEAAARLGVRYGLDLEDFHAGEQDGPDSRLMHALAERVARHVLPDASVLTAASPLIADAYGERHGRRPDEIHNTFSIVERHGRPADPHGLERDALRLYWFSQTIGPGRGLEDVIRAIGRSDHVVELHLRGRATPDHSDRLSALAREVAPRLRVAWHAPAGPDMMVRLAQGYDAGLSSEEPRVLNRRLCLTNKIFTYLAAGVPAIVSRTDAQARFADALGAAVPSYAPGDVDGLADLIVQLASNRGAREHAADEARAAARTRWHWEHPDDRGRLLALIERAA
jgi:glycosyltransferase involved in cell wall biosynthesis